MTVSNPNRDEILATLRANEKSLRDRGVAHAALFGSHARGSATTDSDIDIMIELDPDQRVGLFGYAGIVHAIEDMFLPSRVDVANREGLKPHVRPTAEQYAVYAF